MQILHVICFKGHCSIEHCEEHNSCGPQISFKALVTFVPYDFRRDVRRSTRLLIHDLVGLNWFTDAEISDFDVTLTIEQNIVQLYVTMQNLLAMNVAYALNHLFEENFWSQLVQLFSFTNKVEHVTTCAKLHHQHDVTACFECLVELNDWRVPQLQKNRNFMHNLRPLLFLRKILLVDRLDRDEFPC